MNRPRPSSTAAATLLVASLLACGGGSGERGAAAAGPAPLVEAVQARYGALPVEETVVGVVRARNQVAIRPEIEARVMEVLVRSGDAVERGQPLVRLDPDEPRERLRQAEADVRLAEAAATAARARVAELEARVVRSRALAAEELLSAQELDTLEAQLDVVRASAAEATARVEQARATAQERRSALEKTVVRAPVAGRLGERRVEEGMLVDPATVLFLVGDLDELIVEVTLTEAMLATVEAGQPVVIAARDAGTEPIRATLSRVSPFLAEQSFTTVGEIDLANPGGRLRPGTFVNVRVLVGESRRAVLVPVAALWEDPASGEGGVFVVVEAQGLEASGGAATAASEEPREVVFRPVEVLARGRGAAGVEGIDREAWVVTIGQQLLGAELRAPGRTDATAGEPAAAGATLARVRPVSWQHVTELQELQDEDLLEEFLTKQRIVADALGAEIPASEDAVERALAEADAVAGAGGD